MKTSPFLDDFFKEEAERLGCEFDTQAREFKLKEEQELNNIDYTSSQQEPCKKETTPKPSIAIFKNDRWETIRLSKYPAPDHKAVITLPEGLAPGEYEVKLYTKVGKMSHKEYMSGIIKKADKVGNYGGFGWRPAKTFK